MIRFSAQGAYLLLVPQERTLIRDRALISFLRNNQMFKKRFNIYLKHKKRNRYLNNVCKFVLLEILHRVCCER